MPTRRSYDDGCASAHALDLVGERWALLVVRELLLGPKRFTDLRADLRGISANVLTQRLQELEQSGLLWRRKLPPPANAWVYELTPWGLELEPVILALGRWGTRSPFLRDDIELTVDSLMLSFRAMFVPDAAAGLVGSYELRFGDRQFAVEIDNGRLALGRGAARRPCAVIDTDTLTLSALVYHGADLDEAIESGRLSFTGERAAVEAFSRLFSLPEPAPSTSAPPRFAHVATALTGLERDLSR